MSIINDALKKAGQPIYAETKKSGFQPELLKKKGRINWGPLFVAAVLVLVTAPILAPIVKDLSLTSPEQAPELPTTIMKKQFAVEEVPTPPAIERPALMGVRIPRFSLNGLIYSEGGSYCLINGKVVKAGETVSGATLVRVTPTEAVLDYLGEKIVLTADAA